MSAPTIQPQDCCSTCTDVAVTNIPGPAGSPGVSGSNGTNGVNAFTVTTAQFTQPGVGNNVTVSVANSSWTSVGQNVFVPGGGYYIVAVVPDGVTMVLGNLGYAGNSAPGTIIPSTSLVSPSGIKGDNGTNSSGDMLRANNLSDVLSAAASRGNLGLGALAVLGSVNNGNWSGTALAVNNGGTGAITAAAARTNLSAQLQDAILDALAALVTANNDMLYFTGVDAPALLHNTTSYGRAFLTDGDNVATRFRLGKVLPRYGLLGSASGVDLNAGATDTAITLEPARCRIDRITVEGAAINTTTATAGVFTAAGGAGVTIAADQSLAALTAGTKVHDLTLGAIAGTDVVPSSTLYFRVGTAQSSADTANVWIFGWRYD